MAASTRWRYVASARGAVTLVGFVAASLTQVVPHVLGAVAGDVIPVAAELRRGRVLLRHALADDLVEKAEHPLLAEALSQPPHGEERYTVPAAGLLGGGSWRRLG